MCTSNSAASANKKKTPIPNPQPRRPDDFTIYRKPDEVAAWDLPGMAKQDEKWLKDGLVGSYSEQVYFCWPCANLEAIVDGTVAGTGWAVFRARSMICLVQCKNKFSITLRALDKPEFLAEYDSARKSYARLEERREKRRRTKRSITGSSCPITELPQPLIGTIRQDDKIDSAAKAGGYLLKQENVAKAVFEAIFCDDKTLPVGRR